MNRVCQGLAVVIASGLGVVASQAQQPGTGGQPQGLPPSHELPPSVAPTPPKGSAAITPHLAAVPAFTLDDARRYVVTRPLPLGAARDYKPNVTRTEFLTSRQVRERLHGVVTGFPADHVLCYVELQGPFSFPGPQGAVATYNRGVLIFDAQTGNLLISGGMP
jgi:hypothetical protein